jgi:hypothetical protein
VGDSSALVSATQAGLRSERLGGQAWADGERRKAVGERGGRVEQRGSTQASRDASLGASQTSEGDVDGWPGGQSGGQSERGACSASSSSWSCSYVEASTSLRKSTCQLREADSEGAPASSSFCPTAVSRQVQCTHAMAEAGGDEVFRELASEGKTLQLLKKLVKELPAKQPVRHQARAPDKAVSSSSCQDQAAGHTFEGETERWGGSGAAGHRFEGETERSGGSGGSEQTEAWRNSDMGVPVPGAVAAGAVPASPPRSGRSKSRPAVAEMEEEEEEEGIAQATAERERKNAWLVKKLLLPSICRLLAE